MRGVVLAGFRLIALGLGMTVSAHAHSYKTAYSFQGYPDGCSPQGDLLAVNGVLYGTTNGGSPFSEGTVFAFDPATGTETVLHGFGAGNDGSGPTAGLIDVDGLLYGTTLAGGDNGRYGTVFSVDPKTGAETIIHAFGAGADGAFPESTLLRVGDMLWGTTSEGGAGQGPGTIFSVRLKTGAERVRHSFTLADGAFPTAGLVDIKGTLYGTTIGGGDNTAGVLFSFDPKTDLETPLFSFGLNSGDDPVGPMIAVRGQLYGATATEGPGGSGTVYNADPSTDHVGNLFDFKFNRNGNQPVARLVAVGGTLYGTTQFGGTGAMGTVFSIDLKSGKEHVVHSFAGETDGLYPYAGMVDIGGTLYGTTNEGGSGGCGTIFSIKLK